VAHQNGVVRLWGLVVLGSSLGIYTYAGKEFSSNRSGEKTKEERQKEIEKQKQILRTNISLALYYCYVESR
jgi:hypothetical protein